MRTILVVDDNLAVRTFFNVCLSEAGYLVIEAGDGAEALRVMDSHDIDLVFCDIFMPNQDGLETIQELRGLHPDSPIVAMTGLGRQYGDCLLMAAKFGAVETLEKPVSRETLLSTASRCQRAEASR